MSVRQKIQSVIGLHRERVAQLFELYGIDLPLTVQNVYDALYVNGKDFANDFWSIETLNFAGKAKEKISSFFQKPVEVVEDNRPIIVIAVAVIVVLVVLVILTRKKDAK